MEEIKKEILGTYSCIISVLEKMPGMKMEDAFRSSSIEDLRREHAYLKKIFEEYICNEPPTMGMSY